MGRSLVPLALIWLVSAITMGIVNLFVEARGPGFQPNSGFVDSGQTLIEESRTDTLPDLEELAINERGLEIIRHSEGLRLKAYQGYQDTWLIGYGHSADVTPDMVITEEEADRLLRQDIKAAEDGVRNLLTTRVTQNEFSAMVSLAYNIGVRAFADSTVLNEVNRHNSQAAADAFLMWNKVGGKAYTHLTRRRQQERALFLSE